MFHFVVTDNSNDPRRRTQKSVAELEKLCLQKEAVNFVYPSTSHGRNKVITHLYHLAKI